MHAGVEYNAQTGPRRGIVGLLVSLQFRQDIHDRCSSGTAAVLSADLCKEDHAATVNQKRRRVRGFIGSIPAQSIQIRELVAWINQQVEIAGKFLVGDKLRGSLPQIP